MGDSFFKGISNFVQETAQGPESLNKVDLFLGHVLKVKYSTDGEITVRVLGRTKEYEDSDIKITAFPANANIVKYPIPGEIVVLFSSIVNPYEGTKQSTSYYYLDIVAVNQHLTINSNAYVGLAVPVKMADKIFTPQYNKRFIQQYDNAGAFLSDASDPLSYVNKSSIKLLEGDVVLQGRFGASIRLGGTIVNTKTETDKINALFNEKDPNNPQWSQGGITGTPVIVISSNGRQDSYSYEDVNQTSPTLSTMHICTTQTIPVDMTTSKLLSLKHVYNRSTLNVSKNDLSAFLNTEFHPQVAPIVSWSGTGNDLTEHEFDSGGGAFDGGLPLQGSGANPPFTVGPVNGNYVTPAREGNPGDFMDMSKSLRSSGLVKLASANGGLWPIPFYQKPGDTSGKLYTKVVGKYGSRNKYEENVIFSKTRLYNWSYTGKTGFKKTAMVNMLWVNTLNKIAAGLDANNLWNAQAIKEWGCGIVRRDVTPGNVIYGSLTGHAFAMAIDVNHSRYGLGSKYKKIWQDDYAAGVPMARVLGYMNDNFVKVQGGQYKMWWLLNTDPMHFAIYQLV